MRKSGFQTGKGSLNRNVEEWEKRRVAKNFERFGLKHFQRQGSEEGVEPKEEGKRPFWERRFHNGCLKGDVHVGLLGWFENPFQPEPRAWRRRKGQEELLGKQRSTLANCVIVKVQLQSVHFWFEIAFRVRCSGVQWAFRAPTSSCSNIPLQHCQPVIFTVSVFERTSHDRREDGNNWMCHPDGSGFSRSYGRLKPIQFGQSIWGHNGFWCVHFGPIRFVLVLVLVLWFVV